MKKVCIFLFLTLSLLSDNRFQVSGSVIKDFETELMWQRESSSSTMNWNRAKSYCKDLSLGGYSDWRLPHIDELKSIVNYGAYSPATFNGFKLNTNDWHWSITKYNSSVSWIVDFNFGNDLWYYQADSFYAVCVRDL